MMKENIKSVGADASVRPTPKARQNKGITLIALVITIIVMLILVAVTISMAINGGLFDYAGKAVGETQNAIDEEQKLAEGKIKIGETWYNSIDEYINSDGEVNFEELFKTATKHPDQTETDDIGIAEDGSIVNLDLWYYTLIGDNDEYVLAEYLGSQASAGYKGDIVKPEGTIRGKVPMYIKEDGEDNFYPVTSMRSTFRDCTELIIAPEIPSSVTDLWGTFNGCSGLTKAPEIPIGVTDMRETFANCSALTTATEIPSSVTLMNCTFQDCSALTGTLKINATPTHYIYCLRRAATAEGCILVLEGPSATVLNNILSTATSGNVTIKQ